ncbi:MAG TPA: hypothetical protein VNA20_15890 [Frankiaceae bacterium]|nr:hypothetical protein [Frankiaceae bacterium]
MSAWGPLRVAGGQLIVGSAVFTPAGLVAGDRTFAWDDAGGRPFHVDPEGWPGTPPAGWAVEVLITQGMTGSFAQSSVLAVAGHTGAPPHYDEPVSYVRIGVVFHALALHRVVAAAAIVAFLRDEPRARAGLADRARVTALLAGVRATTRLRSGLPREPLMGDAHDLHWAVLRAFRDGVPRRYADRRVDLDPLPPMADLVTGARLHLRPALREKYGDAEIAKRMRRYVERAPWPFSVLT